MAEGSVVEGFLSLLEPNERATVAQVGPDGTYRRGDRLFLEGDRTDVVYLVVEGRARVLTTTAEGNEVTLSVRGRGELIGEMSALDPGSRRSASVVALDTLRCQVIASSELRAFLDVHPRATVAVLRLMIGRLREADRRRTEFGSYDAIRRLARILVETADADTRSATRSASLALSQRELAGLIGASAPSRWPTGSPSCAAAT